MSNDAMLMLSLLAILLGTMFAGPTRWWLRAMLLLAVLQINAAWLVYKLHTVIYPFSLIDNVYGATDALMAWSVATIGICFVHVSKSVILFKKSNLNLSMSRVWVVGAGVWFALLVLAFASDNATALRFAAGCLFVTALMLASVRRTIIDNQNHHPSVRNRIHIGFMSALTLGVFVLMLRQIYQASVSGSGISLSDQIAWRLVILLGLYLPLYAWSEQASKQVVEKNDVKRQLEEQLESIGSLLANGTELSSNNNLGLVVTDSQLTIRYMNAAARSLVQDGNGLLKGVRLCKVLGNLNNVSPSQLRSFAYVLIEPMASAERSLVELKAVSLPPALRSRLHAFTMRRVIADPPVLDYLVARLYQHHQTAWWVVDERGEIVHAAGGDTLPSEVAQVLTGQTNLSRVLQSRVMKTDAVDQWEARFLLREETAVRVDFPAKAKDQMFYFYPLYVGRPEQRRWLVTVAPVPKVPPLKGPSRLFYWRAEE